MATTTAPSSTSRNARVAEDRDAGRVQDRPVVRLVARVLGKGADLLAAEGRQRVPNPQQHGVLERRAEAILVRAVSHAADAEGHDLVDAGGEQLSVGEEPGDVPHQVALRPALEPGSPDGLCLSAAARVRVRESRTGGPIGHGSAVHGQDGEASRNGIFLEERLQPQHVRHGAERPVLQARLGAAGTRVSNKKTTNTQKDAMRRAGYVQDKRHARGDRAGRDLPRAEAELDRHAVDAGDRDDGSAGDGGERGVEGLDDAPELGLREEPAAFLVSGQVPLFGEDVPLDHLLVARLLGDEDRAKVKRQHFGGGRVAAKKVQRRRRREQRQFSNV